MPRTVRARSFAHLSDLHLGAGRRHERNSRRLLHALEQERVDLVLVTGDVTHRGRLEELDHYRRLVEPLGDRVLVVPGNHDRMSHDVAGALQAGPRVQASSRPGLHVVRVDSTAPHNRRLSRGHGHLSEGDLADIEAALDAAPVGALGVLMLHHHPLPLPPEDPGERITTWMGLPWCAELRRGPQLLSRIRGKCDLVLHGHRHVPAEQHPFPGDTRPLRVFNAGSSAQHGRARVFHHDRGALVEAPRWLEG